MSTKLIRSLSHITKSMQNGVVSIGNFDGVHKGHQQLVELAIKKANSIQKETTVITFEPLPYEFFKKPVTVPRLSRLREKYAALNQCHLDNLLILPFNQELAATSASDFVKLIHEALHPQHIIIGDDFRFGYQRAGDFQFLSERGRGLGFTVDEMKTVTFEGSRISSTRVRQALADADHDLVNQLLGHPYYMLGRIVHGNKLGSELGFPTANINVHRALSPVHGIYTVMVHGLGERALPGVASIGERPTVLGSKTLLEVHLIDFSANIYGRAVRVDFCQKLRNECRFPDLSSLAEQIARDVAQAKQLFSKSGVI